MEHRKNGWRLEPENDKDNDQRRGDRAYAGASCSGSSRQPAAHGLCKWRGAHGCARAAPPPAFSSARNRQLPEGDAEIPAAPLAAQRKRNLSLRHHLGLRGFHCTRMRFGGRIGAEDLIDAVHRGEFAATVFDRRLADGETAALRAQRDRARLPVAALDGAGALGSLVKRGPSLHRKGHFAFDVRLRRKRRRRMDEQGGGSKNRKPFGVEHRLSLDESMGREFTKTSRGPKIS